MRLQSRAAWLPSVLPAASAADERRSRRLRPAHDAAGRPGPEDLTPGEEERRRGQTALLLPHQRKGTTGSRLSCGTCPRPTRRRPSAANRGSPQGRGQPSQEQGSGLGRPGPDADAGRRRASPTMSDRRSKSPACIKRRGAMPAARFASTAGCARRRPTSRVAASCKRLAALRSTTTTRHRRGGGRARWTTSTTRGGPSPNTA